jgi:hypothetical protein
MENRTNFKSYEWTRNLSALFNDQCHADVTLICEGEKIWAHRSVLASLSPLFSQLLMSCESLVEPTIILEGFRYNHHYQTTYYIFTFLHSIVLKLWSAWLISFTMGRPKDHQMTW